MQRIGSFIVKTQYETRKPKNPVHEVVQAYLEERGWGKVPSKSYPLLGVSYPRLAKEAKELLGACNENLEDALWCIQKIASDSRKSGMNYTIRTCLKYKGF